MKKQENKIEQSKEQGKMIDNLKQQSSSLIMLVSSIVVIMVIAYLGISFNKGTYSVQSSGDYGCLNSLYPTRTSYPLINVFSSIGALVFDTSTNEVRLICTNSDYVFGREIKVENGIGYCSKPVSEANCDGTWTPDPTVDGVGICSVPCAIAPVLVSASVGASCTTSNGTSGTIGADFECHAVANVCPSEKLAYISESDGQILILKSSTCDCPSGEGWAYKDVTHCTITPTVNASSSSIEKYYYKSNLAGCYEAGGYHWTGGRCVKCNSGYVYSEQSLACIMTSSEQTVTLTFKNDDDSVFATRSCTIAAGSEACSSDLYAPGPATSTKNAGTFNGWGETLGCETGTNTANASFHITRGSTNRTYYACYKTATTEPTTSATFDVNNCSYSMFTAVTRDQRYLNCKYTNIAYGTNANGYTEANIKACCQAKGYTWVGENFSSSGGSGGQYEYCIICSGTNPTTPTVETINKDRCIIGTNRIVRVTTCEYLVSGDCTTNPSGNANVMCTLLDGTTVKRCNLTDDLTRCQTPDTDVQTKKCYYCQGKNVKYKSVATTENCPTGYVENSSLLNCVKTCYTCEGTEEIASSEKCVDHGFADSRDDLDCTKTCYTCEGTNKVEKTIDSSKNCTDYPGYADTKEELTCTKVCYTCEGTDKVKKTIPSSKDCSDYSGYASSKSALVCEEPKEDECCICDENGKVVKKGKTTTGKCPTGQTLCTEIVCETPPTGSSAIIVAWIVGLFAIAYSVYYFTQTNKIKD